MEQLQQLPYVVYEEFLLSEVKQKEASTSLCTVTCITSEKTLEGIN